jgi:mRNA-degrading endonuclease RelE of RelBE toxin-antitoxin system
VQSPEQTCRIEYPIKKLQGVSVGEGQHRLRSGRFRFSYDIAGREVVLLYCGLRREDTYCAYEDFREVNAIDYSFPQQGGISTAV